MTIADLITDDISSIVVSQPWKHGPRSRPINAIVWHFTGSGIDYDADTEYGATLNWFRSPNNVVHDGNQKYAGMSNLVVGAGKVCLAVPLAVMPKYSSWASDEHAISIEVAHSFEGQAWNPQVIETCVAVGAALREAYNIPHIRVRPRDEAPDDWRWAGEAGHQDTWQGREAGKADPGEEFWALYMEADMGMSNDERKLMDNLIKVAVGNEARLNWLVEKGVNPLEWRVNRIESDPGPTFLTGLDARLKHLEEINNV